MNQKFLKLWLKYDDGREYVEYNKAGKATPEDVQLQWLRESARRADNRVIESAWSYVEHTN